MILRKERIMNPVRALSSKIGQMLQTLEQGHKSSMVNNSLQALTPTLLSEGEFQHYASEFEFIFNDSQIRNIALTGPYGAGKSTVIQTWSNEQRHDKKGHRCTYISLAHFEESNDSINNIESEILNQLVHKTRGTDIPKTRFRHTSNDSWRWTIFKSFIILLFSCLSIAAISLLIRDGLFLPNATALSHPILDLTWISLFFLLLIYGVRRNSLTNLIRRIRILGNEVELFDLKEYNEESSDSVFNRYMDDVLYLLNGTSSDVIIFEDLDRFKEKSIGILEKLREINELANECRMHKRGTLRFIYLVRDDLFTSAENRAKFFDYIIPVAPFIDSENAFVEMRACLRSIGLKIREPFLYGLSTFIFDSRLLKDILNETQHYLSVVFGDARTQLNEDEAEHLVAMMAYKASWPDDFSSFQIGQGCVRKILDSKEELISSCSRELQSERSELLAEIREIDEKVKVNLEIVVLIENVKRWNELDNLIERTRFTNGQTVTSSKTWSDRLAVIKANKEALLDQH